MSTPQAHIYYFVFGLVALSLASLLLKGDNRKIAANTLLFLATCFCVTFLYTAFAGHKLAQTNSALSVQQTDMSLRMIGLAEYLRRKAFEHSPNSNNQLLSLHSGQKDAEAFKSAETTLRAAIEQEPNQGIYPAQLAILLGACDLQKNKAEITKLLESAEAANRIKPTDKLTSLMPVLRTAYLDDAVTGTIQDKNAYDTIVEVLGSGWFSDQALERLYQHTNDTAAIDAHQKSLEQSYQRLMGKVLLIILVIVVCGFTGVLTIIFAVSNPSERPDPVGISVSWKMVYAMLVAWLSAQAVAGLAFYSLISGLNLTFSSPLEMAAKTLTVYVFSNLPATMILYFVALRPLGQGFRKPIRLTFKTETAGPGKLIIGGFLGWCAAIPLVICAGVLAHFVLQSHGSDNPVLQQLLKAASEANPAAIIIFYLTVGVIAPFFEEIMFRGFLYSALRPHLGTAGSVLLTAALFSAIHFDKGGLLPLFAIGATLAYLYERTGSLVPSIICHGLWNSGTLTVALLLFGNR